MSATRIRPLERVTRADLVRLVRGYVSDAAYGVRVAERRGEVMFRLRRIRLQTPFAKEFPRPAEDTRRYQQVVRRGWSYGAYEGEALVGLALAEPRPWNRSVWVWELGVAPTHRRRGIGRGLIEALAHRARRDGYRVLVCETQTTNVPAIDFYRASGFRLEGVDLSYYTNEDLDRGEVAIFMKKRIGPQRRRSPHRPHTSK